MSEPTQGITERISLTIDPHKPEDKYAWITVTYEDGSKEGLAGTGGRIRRELAEHLVSLHGQLEEVTPSPLWLMAVEQQKAKFDELRADLADANGLLAKANKQLEEANKRIDGFRQIVSNVAKALFPSSPKNSAEAEFDLDAMGACQVIRRLLSEREDAHRQLEDAQTEINSVAGILDRLYAPLARSIDNSEKVDMDDVEPVQACMSELMAVWFRLMPGSSKVGIVRAAAKASERRAQG